jgi:ribosomal protein S18 acetylase RimI-like enzyme
VETITVKKVTPEMVDGSFIAALKSAFPLEEECPDWELESARAFVCSGKNLLFVGYLGGEMAGYAYGHALDRFDTQKHFLVYEVATAKKFRRRGVMKAVLGELLACLKAAGFAEAWVITNKSNAAAMSLYAATGGRTEHDDDCMFVYDLKQS